MSINPLGFIRETINGAINLVAEKTNEVADKLKCTTNSGDRECKPKEGFYYQTPAATLLGVLVGTQPLPPAEQKKPNS